jgi:hypothetical protein
MVQDIMAKNVQKSYSFILMTIKSDERSFKNEFVGKYHEEQCNSICIHSGFRSSSTWFWSKFRLNEGLVCYYEPFNEQLGALTLDTTARPGRKHGGRAIRKGRLMCSNMPVFWLKAVALKASRVRPAWGAVYWRRRPGRGA